jgi:hypothetical protein
MPSPFSNIFHVNSILFFFNLDPTSHFVISILNHRFLLLIRIASHMYNTCYLIMVSSVIIHEENLNNQKFIYCCRLLLL